MFNKLKNHIGHKISIVSYSDVNISIECEDCNEVLIDINSNEELYWLDDEGCSRG